MTTIREAQQHKEWVILGRLVYKMLFYNRKPNQPGILLTLLLIDEDGVMIELKTWRPLKAYCVYRKVHENQYYMIEGKGPMTQPNQKYSNVKYQTARWFIKDSGEFALTKYVPSAVDVFKVKEDLQRGRLNNVLGSFVKLHKGPRAPISSVQGYYVELVDRNETHFYVLVWHVRMSRGRSSFSLMDCEPGDVVLVNCVRELMKDPIIYTNNNYYSLTSTCPPLVNSPCVSPKRMQELRKKFSYNYL